VISGSSLATLSPVTCHPSPVTCHLSPVTCHLSPVTCHLSPVMSTTQRSRITYVGHATVLVEMGGVRILTDPVLRRRIYHLRRRNVPIPEGFHEKLDAVLISHMHHDHLDVPSLRRLGKSTRLIAPNGAGALLRHHGFRRVEELRVGERTMVGNVQVTATFALHSGARGPLGPSAETLGFVLGGEMPGAAALPRIYFAGDTDVFPEMAQYAGTLDLALLPVWGWGPTLGPGHMDPQRAAEACRLLAPQVAIPIHWGTLYPLAVHRITSAFLIDPPNLFAEFVLHMAPQVDVRILDPGEHWDVDARP
jgi:L-ascorbate metabolism protein UlaG (beta-lactamase superfamily)